MLNESQREEGISIVQFCILLHTVATARLNTQKMFEKIKHTPPELPVKTCVYEDVAHAITHMEYLEETVYVQESFGVRNARRELPGDVEGHVENISWVD